MKSSLSLLVLLAGLAPLWAQSSPSLAAAAFLSEWVNAARLREGLTVLETSPVLARTAREYARELAAAGRLSHRDSRGGSALERQRDRGGAALRVGEVLGAGPDPARVARAWLDSGRHRAVLLDPGWTHLGVGTAPAGGGQRVWVVLAAVLAVKDLAVRPAEGGYLLSGSFVSQAAVEPVLLSGLDPVEPRRFEPAGRSFLYLLPAGHLERYHRLGYRDREGRLHMAGSFFPDRLLTSSGEKAPR